MSSDTVQLIAGMESTLLFVRVNKRIYMNARESDFVRLSTHNKEADVLVRAYYTVSDTMDDQQKSAVTKLGAMAILGVRGAVERGKKGTITYLHMRAVDNILGFGESKHQLIDPSGRGLRVFASVNGYNVFYMYVWM